MYGIFKMAKLYLHRYQGVTAEPFSSERVVRGKIKANFPNAYAILGPENKGQRPLVYRIPVLTGINEVRVSPRENETGLVNVTVSSADLLGGGINKKLKQVLKELNFTEKPTVLPIIEVSEWELKEHKARQFSLKEADRNAADILRVMQNPRTSARCLDEIRSDDLGFYLETRTNLLFEQENIRAFASYDSRAKKLEVMRYR